MGKRHAKWMWLTAVVLAVALWPRPRFISVSNETPITLPPQEKLVALTFDDGPRRSTTTQLLDGLAQRGARATFFLIGSQAEANAALVERMAAEGHQIGVHTYDHVLVTDLDREEFTRQVEGTRRILYRILGETELWLRPPYGIYNDNTAQWADSPIVLWSVDPEDWSDSNTQRIVRHVLSHAGDGDIILMHDIYPSSVEAALEIIDSMQRDGYRFVTVRELLEARGISPEIGHVYLYAS